MKNDLKKIELIYNYLSKKYYPINPDFVLILGSSDLKVAEFSSNYLKENPINNIIISGGFGKITKDLWKVSEAKKFSEILIKNGIPEKFIYLDEKASNTGDNILNSKKIIEDNNLNHSEGLIITKPYMTKRAFNTASKQWSMVKWSSISEDISFSDYLSTQKDKNRFINILIGDLQRIKIYGDKGFQLEDEIPKNVWDAFLELVKNGYNQFLIKQ